MSNNHIVKHYPASCILLLTIISNLISNVDASRSPRDDFFLISKLVIFPAVFIVIAFRLIYFNRCFVKSPLTLIDELGEQNFPTEFVDLSRLFKGSPKLFCTIFGVVVISIILLFFFDDNVVDWLLYLASILMNICGLCVFIINLRVTYFNFQVYISKDTRFPYKKVPTILSFVVPISLYLVHMVAYLSNGNGTLLEDPMLSTFAVFFWVWPYVIGILYFDFGVRKIAKLIINGDLDSGDKNLIDQASNINLGNLNRA